MNGIIRLVLTRLDPIETNNIYNQYKLSAIA